VASFSAVTLASSILAWLLSTTVTRSVPSKRCARAALPNNIQNTPASAMKISLRIASLLQSYRIVLLTSHAAFSTTAAAISVEMHAALHSKIQFAFVFSMTYEISISERL
jgi:hypothetical protein